MGQFGADWSDEAPSRGLLAAHILGFYGLNIFHLNVKGLSLPNCLPNARWMAQGPDIMTTQRMLVTVRQG